MRGLKVNRVIGKGDSQKINSKGGLTPPTESRILITQLKSAKCTEASYGRKGKPNQSVQSQKVEGWAMQTLLQSVTIRDLTRTNREHRCKNTTVAKMPQTPHQWKMTPHQWKMRVTPAVEIKTLPVEIILDPTVGILYGDS